MHEAVEADKRRLRKRYVIDRLRRKSKELRMLLRQKQKQRKQEEYQQEQQH
jgi:hypothetical protein